MVSNSQRGGGVDSIGSSGRYAALDPAGAQVPGNLTLTLGADYDQSK